MSVRGLPKGNFRSDGSVVPDYGTVEYIDGGGTTGKTISISSMDSDEFTILVNGVSGSGYMYNMGYNETDLEVRCIDYGHNGTGWESVSMTYIEPMPGYELSHDTTVNNSFQSNDGPAWCRARFRKGEGFKGLQVASRRYNESSSTTTTFYITPFSNPMTKPGGLCVAAAFKDWTEYPTTVGGTGWAKGGNGGLTIQGYYILSTTEIETPPQMYFYGTSGRYWAGLLVYLR